VRIAQKSQQIAQEPDMTEEPTPLRMLKQLATEYGRKYNELALARQGCPAKTFIHQLEQHSELTTQQFRLAQQLLLEALGGQEKSLQDATQTIFRCFDEMRLLFQVLVEQCSDSNLS
jgi:hypothetical protein